MAVSNKFGHMLLTIRKLAEEHGLKQGFRTVWRSRFLCSSGTSLTLIARQGCTDVQVGSVRICPHRVKMCCSLGVVRRPKRQVACPATWSSLRLQARWPRLRLGRFTVSTVLKFSLSTTRLKRFIINDNSEATLMARHWAMVRSTVPAMVAPRGTGSLSLPFP